MRPLHPRLALALVALLSAPALGATDFTFTVGLPSAVTTVHPPATKAVIVLDVSADPTSAVFTIDNFSGTDSGVSTPNPVQEGTGWKPLGNGDRARADKVPGANQVRLQFEMKGWLLDPNNLCVVKTPIDPSTKKKFRVSNGALTPSGFRRSTYSAPARLDNPGGVPTNVQCTCSVRRIQENLLSFSPAPGNDLGPVPMDVALVLDKSGSMSGKSDPADAAVKWALLQQAAGMFIDSWTAYIGLTGTGSNADRLGLVYFDGAPHKQLFGGQFFVSRAAGWAQVKTNVLGTTPGGSTALGGGLRDAVNELFGSTNNPDHFALLLTDGLQNQDPKVTPETGLNTKSLDFGPGGALGGGVHPILETCTPIFAIGVGSRLEDVAGELLNSISGQCGGEATVVTGSSVPGAFGDTLRNLLTGNTLTLATRKQGSLQAAVGVGPQTVVSLDATVQAMLVTAAWPPDRAFAGQPIRLIATKPDGKPQEGACTVENSGKNLLHYIVCRFPVSVAGDWKVALERVSPPNVGGVNAVTVPYELSIFPIERSLDYAVSLSRFEHHTGDPIQVDFQVTLDGKGVAGIADRIRVTVERPGGALGTAMHDSRASADPPGGDPDAPNAYFTKLQNLLKDPDFQRRMDPKTDPNLLAVTDKGNGSYSATLPTTTVPGKYRFFTLLDFPHPQSQQPIHRERTIETAVAVKPDPTASSVTASAVGDGVWTFTIVPRDRFQNYLGPGYGGGIVVKVNGQLVQAVPADNGQTGTYVVSVPAGPANPTVSIDVNGASLGSKSLSQWSGKPDTCVGGCCCNLGGDRGDRGAGRALAVALLLLGAVLVRHRSRRQAG